MLSQLTHQLTRAPKTALAILAIIFLILGAYAANLEINPDFSELIPAGGPYNTNERKLEAAFAQNAAMIAVFTLEEDNALRGRPATIPESDLQEHYPGIVSVLNQSQYVTSISPLLISENGRVAQIVLGTQEPRTAEGLKDVKEEIEYLLDHAALPQGVEASVTGLPVILDRVSTLLINDNLSTVAITALLVFIVLLWYFKDLKIALIGVTSPILSAVTLAAAMVALDIQVTLTLAAVGVIVIGLGADYSIHLITAYERRLAKSNPRRALEDALDELEVPLIAAFLTTAAGFAALMLGVSPASQAQGAVLTLAITIIFLLTFLFLPLLLFVFVKTPSKGRASIPGIDAFFRRLAQWQTHHPWTVIGAVAAVTALMLLGASQVAFSTSNSNWIPDDDPVANSFRELTYAFGDTDSATIVVESTRGDLRDVQTVRDLEALTEQVRGIPSVIAVEYPFSDVDLERAAILERAEERRDAFNHDYTLTRMTLRSEGFDVDESGQALILQELEPLIQHHAIHDAQLSLYGDVVRFNELGQSLEADAAVTTTIGLALVFLVASIIYASAVIGLVALVPIIIAVLWAVGLMGFFNVPFTSLSTGIISLVLGIGVDFSLHLVSSIRHNLSGDIEEAIAGALGTTGGAILLSTLTTFFGFLALTFASLLGTRRLGFSLAFSIVAVFAVTILLVPTVVRLRRGLLGKSDKPGEDG